MKSNPFSLALRSTSKLTAATTSFIMLAAIPLLAHSVLSNPSNQIGNKQLIAQSCRNTEIRLTNNQSQTFGRGTRWVTCNNYTLVFQNDGNLVLYSPWGVLWATGTEGKGGALVLQRDGNVVLYDPTNTGKVLWASNTDGNPGAFLALQTDGNLVVYSANGRPLWATGTEGGRTGVRNAATLWSENRASQPTPPVSSNRPLFPLTEPYSTNANCLFGGICRGGGLPTKHTGIDYAVVAGSEVRAICDGVVVFARTADPDPKVNNIWNRFTIVKHENCGGYPVLYAYYGHIDPSVSVNQKVERGKPIGKIAIWPNNSHLHFSAATKYFNVGWGYQQGDLPKNGWIDAGLLFR